jgi:hypothetical protein
MVLRTVLKAKVIDVGYSETDGGHEKTIIAAAGLLLLLAGCAPSGGEQADPPSPSPTLATARDVINALEANGFDVRGAKQDTEENYITEVGGESWELDIEHGAEDAIHIFPNPESLQVWVPMSKSFGGIAVTGDTWAISLDSDDRKKSLPLADRITDALEGTVQA